MWQKEMALVRIPRDKALPNMNSTQTVKINYKINEEESAKCLIKLRSTRTPVNLVIEYIM